MISIIMPAYNAEKYITEAISSVLAQTYPDWELLIIDDASTDRTAEIARNFSQKDLRIHYYHNNTNLGVSQSRMRGVGLSAGIWIAFLDSDDIWRADKLEKQSSLCVKNPSAALVYTASAFMDDSGNYYAYIMRAKPKVSYNELLYGNILSCSSIMVKKTLIQKYPMKDDSIHEDYATWLQILREIPYAYGIDEPLLVYRLTDSSKSSNRIKSGKMVYKTYRYIGYDAVKSSVLTLRYLYYSVNKRRRIYA